MCEVCRQTPCNSRCPNAVDEWPLSFCSFCNGPIFYGDEYMETPDGPVCKDCVEEMSVLDFMELVGEKFLKAEREM